MRIKDPKNQRVGEISEICSEKSGVGGAASMIAAMDKASSDYADLLKRRMKRFAISPGHLGMAMGVERRSVQHWMNGKGPPRKKKVDIRRFFARRAIGRRHSHPHEQLVKELAESSIPAGLRIELVGMPGLLKSKLLDDLDNRLSDPQSRRDHFYFKNLRSCHDIGEFWNTLGQKIIGTAKRHYDMDAVNDALSRTSVALLLDDADLFLANIEKRSPFTFNSTASQWIQDMVSLPTSIVMTSAIACNDFVDIVSGGSNSYFSDQGFDQWYREAAWDFWTASLLQKKLRKIVEIKELSKQIPVVFLESLRYLQAQPSANVTTIVETTHRLIAKSIWSRIPPKSRQLLINNRFELSEHSHLFKALMKSGVITSRQRSLEKSLRVPSWFSVWKSEARS